MFRDGDEVYTQSRDLKPLDRYFPELADPLRAALPERCVLDGEVVIARDGALDFEALLLRIHPAASRVKMLAEESPAQLRRLGPARARRRGPARGPAGRATSAARGASSARAAPPVHLTPATRDRATAADWFERFEGAGLDGVVAKRLDAPYQPGKRAMLKIKHQRTADCVVAGFRWHKNGPGTHVGSLLLGLYDDEGTPAPRRRHLVVLVGAPGGAGRRARAAPRERAGRPPVGELGRVGGRAARPRASGVPGATSRWNRGKDLSWEPLRAERVAEVAYDHLQGDRFRHATTFKRWRPDKPASACRYDQLEETAAVPARRGSSAPADSGVRLRHRRARRSQSQLDPRFPNGVADVATVGPDGGRRCHPPSIAAPCLRRRGPQRARDARHRSAESRAAPESRR